MIKATYFLDVTSSWCFWAEPAWAELRERFSRKVEFSWKIALLDSRAVPPTAAAMDWYYRRSGTIMQSPFRLNTGWFEPNAAPYLVPNLVAEAGKACGVTDDRLRLALACAGLHEGRRILQWEESLRVVAKLGLDVAVLKIAAEAADTKKKIEASTSEFHSLKVTQRPTFVIENEIGDRAVFSGVANANPLIATIEAMGADEAAYQSYGAHYGTGPT